MHRGTVSNTDYLPDKTSASVIMELHKTLVLDPNSAATSPTSSANPTSATPVTSAASPTITNPAAQMGMPLTIPGLKPLQLVGGINGMNGLNGYNGLGTIPAQLNGLNFGMMDPLLMAAAPQQPTNFTGKVRIGMAAVKTGSPKFAPY